MKYQTHAMVVLAMTNLFCVCACNDEGARTASGNGEMKPTNAIPSHDRDRGKEDINEDTAIKIAKEAVKKSPLAGRVPEDAKHSVKFIESRIEVTFLRPVDPNPVPSSGYYAMVWIDAKSGEAIVLGEP